MTEKQKYIASYLDGYFSEKKISYSMQYFSMLKNATKKAKKNWRKYKKKEL